MLTHSYSAIPATLRGRPFLMALLAVYAVFYAVTAYNPVNRFDWFLENLLVFAVLIVLAATYRRMPLSDVSYIMLCMFLMLHGIGGYYTFSIVPFGFWMQEAFDFSRNHYDRLVHFSFGLLMFYPMRELILRRVTRNSLHAGLFALAVNWAMSGTFEIIEMIIALIVDPEAGIAYLGTQGDEWDAQKDMALASLGALVAFAVVEAATRALGIAPISDAKTRSSA